MIDAYFATVGLINECYHSEPVVGAWSAWQFKFHWNGCEHVPKQAEK
jgi:hypothetical protein